MNKANSLTNSGNAGGGSESAFHSILESREDDEKDELNTIHSNVLSSVFGVLFTLSKEKTETEIGFYWQLAKICVDYWQLFSTVISPSMGWSFSRNGRLWWWLSLPNFYFLQDLDYSVYVGLLYTMVSLLVTNILLSVYVAYGFHKRRFDYVWPIKVQRVFSSVFFQVFDVASLNLLQVAFSCQFTGPISGRVGSLLVYPSKMCTDLPQLVHAIVGGVFMLLFILLAVLLNVAEVEVNIYSRLPSALGHSGPEVVGFLLKAVLTTINVFLNLRRVVSILYLLIAAYLVWVYYRWSPHFYQWSNHLKVGTFTSIFYTTFILTIMVFNPGMRDHEHERIDKFRRSMTYLMAGGLLPSGFVGCFVSWWRLNRFQERVVVAFRSATPESNPKEIFRFTDPKDVEIAARCGRVWDAADNLDKGALAMAGNIIKVGLEYFPSDPFVMMLQANYLMDGLGLVQAAHRQLQLVSKQDPSIMVRFMLFVREQIATQHAAGRSGAMGSHMDLVGYMEYQRKYTLVVRVHKEALMAISQFWQLLQSQNISFNRLSGSLHTIDETVRRAERSYHMILDEYGNNTKVLRLYGKFLETVKNDPSAASRYYAEATKLDELHGDDSEMGGDDGVMMTVGEAAFGTNTAPEAPPGAPETMVGDCLTLVANAAGIIQMTNKQTTSLLGYRKGELEGKNLKGIMPQPWSSRHGTYMKNYIRRGDDRVALRPTHAVVLHRYGYGMAIRLSLAKTSGIGEDSVFVGMLQLLKAPSGVCRLWVLPSGVVTCADTEFCATFGYNPAELVGARLSRLLHKEKPKDGVSIRRPARAMTDQMAGGPPPEDVVADNMVRLEKYVTWVMRRILPIPPSARMASMPNVMLGPRLDSTAADGLIPVSAFPSVVGPFSNASMSPASYPAKFFSSTANNNFVNRSMVMDGGLFDRNRVWPEKEDKDRDNKDSSNKDKERDNMGSKETVSCLGDYPSQRIPPRQNTRASIPDVQARTFFPEDEELFAEEEEVELDAPAVFFEDMCFKHKYMPPVTCRVRARNIGTRGHELVELEIDPQFPDGGQLFMLADTRGSLKYISADMGYSLGVTHLLPAFMSRGAGSARREEDRDIPADSRGALIATTADGVVDLKVLDFLPMPWSSLHTRWLKDAVESDITSAPVAMRSCCSKMPAREGPVLMMCDVKGRMLPMRISVTPRDDLGERMHQIEAKWSSYEEASATRRIQISLSDTGTVLAVEKGTPDSLFGFEPEELAGLQLWSFIDMGTDETSLPGARHDGVRELERSMSGVAAPHSRAAAFTRSDGGVARAAALYNVMLKRSMNLPGCSWQVTLVPPGTKTNIDGMTNDSALLATMLAKKASPAVIQFKMSVSGPATGEPQMDITASIWLMPLLSGLLEIDVRTGRVAKVLEQELRPCSLFFAMSSSRLVGAYISSLLDASLQAAVAQAVADKGRRLNSQQLISYLTTGSLRPRAKGALKSGTFRQGHQIGPTTVLKALNNEGQRPMYVNCTLASRNATSAVLWIRPADPTVAPKPEALIDLLLGQHPQPMMLRHRLDGGSSVTMTAYEKERERSGDGRHQMTVQEGKMEASMGHPTGAEAHVRGLPTIESEGADELDDDSEELATNRGGISNRDADGHKNDVDEVVQFDKVLAIQDTKFEAKVPRWAGSAPPTMGQDLGKGKVQATEDRKSATESEEREKIREPATRNLLPGTPPHTAAPNRPKSTGSDISPRASQQQQQPAEGAADKVNHQQQNGDGNAEAVMPGEEPLAAKDGGSGDSCEDKNKTKEGFESSKSKHQSVSSWVQSDGMYFETNKVPVVHTATPAVLNVVKASFVPPRISPPAPVPSATGQGKVPGPLVPLSAAQAIGPQPDVAPESTNSVRRDSMGQATADDTGGTMSADKDVIVRRVTKLITDRQMEDGDYDTDTPSRGKDEDERPPVVFPSLGSVESASDGGSDPGGSVSSRGSDYHSAKRFKRLKRMLNSPPALKVLWRFRFHTLATLALMLSVHVIAFGILTSVLKRQAAYVTMLSTFIGTNRSNQAIMFATGVLRNIQQGRWRPGTYNLTSVDYYLDMILDQSNSLRNQLTAISKICEKNGGLAKALLYYTPVKNVWSGASANSTADLYLKESLHNMCTTTISHSRIIFRNYKNWVANNVSLTSTESYKYLDKNLYSKLLSAFRPLLDLLFDNAIPVIDRINNLHLMFLVIEGCFLAFLASAYISMLLSRVAEQRYRVYEVFTTIPIGLTRVLATKTLHLLDEDENTSSEEDDEEEGQGLEADNVGQGGQSGNKKRSTVGFDSGMALRKGSRGSETYLKDGKRSASLSRRKAIVVRAQVADVGDPPRANGRQKGNDDKNAGKDSAANGRDTGGDLDQDGEPLLFQDSSSPDEGPGFKGKIIDFLRKLWQWIKAAVRYLIHRMRHTQSILPSAITEPTGSQNTMFLSEASFGLDPPRALRRDSRATLLMIWPLWFWSLLIIVVYAVGYTMLLSSHTVLANQAIIFFIRARVTKTSLAFHELCSEKDPAKLALRFSDAYYAFKQYQTTYYYLVYGSDAPIVGNATMTNTYPYVRQSITNDSPLMYHFLYDTTACLRANKSSCPDPSWEFYDVTHLGVDGMTNAYLKKLEQTIVLGNQSLSNINLTVPLLDFIFQVTMQDLFDGVTTMVQEHEKLLLRPFNVVVNMHIVVLVVGFLGTMYFVLLHLNPLLKHISKEKSLIAELLSQLPKELDLTKVVAAAVTLGEVPDRANLGSGTSRVGSTSFASVLR